MFITEAVTEVLLHLYVDTPTPVGATEKQAMSSVCLD